MAQSNTSGYIGKTKTGSKKTQPKPHKNILDKKPVQNKWIKNTKTIENQEIKKDIKTLKLIKPRVWESKLQWRQETKKSQRSFSKNKERARLEGKSFNETSKKWTYSPTLSWVKTNTGFPKTKGGWNKEKPLKKITRTWEIPGEITVNFQESESKKMDNKKNPKETSLEFKKNKPAFKIPTWEKEFKKVNKKDLVDPTMI